MPLCIKQKAMLPIFFQEKSGSQRFAVLLILTCIAAVLRFRMLGQEILLHDEAFSWRLASLSLRDILSCTANDVHPPLHYMLLKYWTIVWGDSQLAMRSLSAIIGCLSVPVAYLTYLATAQFFRNLPSLELPSTDRLGALVGSALLAVHCLQVVAGRTSRMYCLGVFFALLSNYCLCNAFTSRCSRRLWWVSYAIVTAAFLYTHYFALYSIASQVTFIAASVFIVPQLSEYRRDLKCLFVALIAICFLYSPWLGVLTHQTREISAGYWISELSSHHAITAIYKWTIGLPTFDGAYYFQPNGEYFRLENHASTVGLVGAAYVIGLLLAFFSRSLVTISFFFQALIPWLLCIVTCILLKESILLVRCLVFAHAFFLYSVSALISTHMSKIAYGVTTALFVACFSYTLIQVPTSSSNKQAIAATNFLVNEGDSDMELTVLFSKPYELLRFDYYLQRASSRSTRLFCLTESITGKQNTHISALKENEIIHKASLAQVVPKSIWLIAENATSFDQNLPGFTKTSEHTFSDELTKYTVYVAKYESTTNATR